MPSYDYTAPIPTSLRHLPANPHCTTSRISSELNPPPRSISPSCEDWAKFVKSWLNPASQLWWGDSVITPDYHTKIFRLLTGPENPTENCSFSEKIIIFSCYRGCVIESRKPELATSEHICMISLTRGKSQTEMDFYVKESLFCRTFSVVDNSLCTAYIYITNLI